MPPPYQGEADKSGAEQRDRGWFGYEFRYDDFAIAGLNTGK